MKKPTRSKRKAGFRGMPFSRLIERDAELAEIRRHYSGRTAEERRKAADWAYHASSANDLFSRALAEVGQESPFSEGWLPGIEALAIDPTYAPALLTVGSMEYQLGRADEARVLFHSLLRLPAATPDLEECIDKAGSFLLDEDDFDEAHDFYSSAGLAFPASTRLLGGLGYALAKLGRRDEAVAVQRRAVELEPNNAELLGDLGWALTENKNFDEAGQVLLKAIALAPPDYARPRHNLEELRRRQKADASFR